MSFISCIESQDKIFSVHTNNRSSLKAIAILDSANELLVEVRSGGGRAVGGRESRGRCGGGHSSLNRR